MGTVNIIFEQTNEGAQLVNENGSWVVYFGLVIAICDTITIAENSDVVPTNQFSSLKLEGPVLKAITLMILIAVAFQQLFTVSCYGYDKVGPEIGMKAIDEPDDILQRSSLLRCIQLAFGHSKVQVNPIEFSRNN